MKRLLGLTIIGLLILAAGGCLESNKAPVAAFTRSPASGVAPLAVFFDATESADSDGSVVSYAWDFGDGAAAGGSATDVTATHTFATAGTYSVTLTVVDDRGKSSETMRMVDVAASDTPPPVGTEIGQRAPDLSLANVRTGESQSLSAFRGYVVLLEFWRSTCSACRTSMPAIEALRAKYAADGLIVVLVSEDVTAEEARVVLDEQGYSGFVGLFDADGAARSLYGVDLVPRAFIIDRQGIVRYEDHPVRIRDRHITPWL
ncbi:MAG: PKD domain-containing protein [Candidatus Bipolaricaulota bacterium]|nr:PKD domain-containing protein [Candidatus Bipolaricaulota bacterium]